MTRKKIQRLFFWLVILAGLTLSASHLSATANTRSANLVINEFVAANGMGLTDEDGDHSDWVEIYNQSDSPVNLAGYALTDDPDQPQKWSFPDITLSSRQYLVVFASGKNRQMAQAHTALHTNFKLNRQGGFLALHSVLEGRFMDMVSPQFPPQLQDVAFGRYGDTLNFGYLPRPTPGSLNDGTEAWAGIAMPVEYSQKPGFYHDPVTVELTSAAPAANIRYTTDGSQPDETNGTLYTGPIALEKTTLLRAVALKPGFLPSNVTTGSYIFLDQVLNQPANPPGFPVNWGTQLTESQGYNLVSPIAGDYALDPEIVNAPRYRETFKNSLLSLPVISLVLNQQHLAHLLTRPSGTAESDEDEHPVSIELIYPDASQPGFQINAAIEIEESQTSPKAWFELLFKNEYGPTKLTYPLFHDSPVEQFDSLMLQAANPADLTAYTRDEWLRSSQRAMSGLGVHGQFVHLYLNGLYWGLYNLTERPNASFMAAYQGNEREDWFIANQNGPLGRNRHPTADRLNYLFTVLSFAERTTTPAPELAVNLTGDAYTTAASYLDQAQFSDYLILSWYAAALDWPAPNWRAAIPLQDTGRQGKVLVWNEPVLDPANGAQPRLIQTLFDRLRQNPDFKVKLADRMYLHLQQENGALSDSQTQARWLSLNNLIDQAIVNESARWGDVNRDQPLTYDDWQRARDEVTARMKGAAARLISLGREAGYYPPLDPPNLSQPGGLVEAGFTLEMSLPPLSNYGVIYYTTDGSDPRMPVTGAVGPTAQPYNEPVRLSGNTTVKARVLLADSTNAEPIWSALNEAGFSVVEQDYKLRLTEVMYNPTGGDDYEYIELKNMGSSPVNLANATMSEGAAFTFPADTPPLAPSQMAVLVSNATTFAERYPNVPITGVYDGHLSNKGEKIVLLDAEGTVLLEFTYNDETGWPISADGRGDSLVLAAGDGDPNNPKNWRASIQLNGSPGADEPVIGVNPF